MADLKDALPRADVQALQQRIAALPEVSDVAYVSKDEALQRFRDARAAQGEEDLTAYLDANPLHASLEVKLLPDGLRNATTPWPGDPSVERVKNITDLVNRVLTVTDFLRTAGVVILAIIGVIVLFIIINAIRLAVVARAEQIEGDAPRRRVRRLHPLAVRVRGAPWWASSGAAIALGVIAAVADPLSTFFMYDFFRISPIRVGAIATWRSS